MQGSLQVKDAAEFFIKNKKNAFKDWTFEDAASFISEAIDRKEFFWSCDDRGQLTGIAVLKDGRHISAIILKAPARLSDYVTYAKVYLGIDRISSFRRNNTLRIWPIQKLQALLNR